MPIYEYQCGACGHKLEVMQRVSDEPMKDCPSCNASALQKLISQVGFRLKGTGWYETDFKNKGKPAGEKDQKSKAETKPADKTDKSDKADKASEKTASAQVSSSAKSSSGSNGDK